MHTSLIRTVAFVLMVAFGSSAAAAQDVGPPGLKLSGLQTVYVRDTAGVETPGKIVQLSPDTLTLLTGGREHRYAWPDIARIQTRDSLKNGAIIGALVGLGLGVLSGGLADCPGNRPAGPCGGARIILVAISTGAYAGIGTGLDALVRGRSTIYAAPPRSGRSTDISRRPSVRLAVSW